MGSIVTPYIHIVVSSHHQLSILPKNTGNRSILTNFTKNVSHLCKPIMSMCTCTYFLHLFQNSGTLPSPSYIPQPTDMSNMSGMPPSGYYQVSESFSSTKKVPYEHLVVSNQTSSNSVPRNIYMLFHS